MQRSKLQWLRQQQPIVIDQLPSPGVWEDQLLAFGLQHVAAMHVMLDLGQLALQHLPAAIETDRVLQVCQGTYTCLLGLQADS